MNVEKHYNDKGELAILLSGGYGAGWSTQFRGKEMEVLASDKMLVEMKINGSSEQRAFDYLSSIGITGVKRGEWDSLVLTFEECGNGIVILEHHGDEYVESADKYIVLK